MNMIDTDYFTMWHEESTDEWIVLKGMGFGKEYHYFKESHKALYFILKEIPEDFLRLKIEVSK